MVVGRTLSEAILSSKSGGPARAGDIVVCEPDLILGTDGSTPMAIDYFEAMGGQAVADATRILLACDHYAPPTSTTTSGFHRRMEDFARTHGIEILPVGGGISFQVALDTDRVAPGDLVVGADSHTVTCGAVGAFATGVGSSDLAGAFLTGRVWLRVPHTIRVVLEGEIPTGVGAKDVALELVRVLGTGTADYAALEFHGPAAAAMPVAERMVLSNMSVDMGAMAGLFDTAVVSDLHRAQRPAVREHTLDVATMEPQVALPHDPGNSVPVGEAVGRPVDWVLLGTCTGGRVHDFREALRVLRAAGGLAPGVTLVVTPPSQAVRAALEADGTLEAFETLGAVVTETGCGPCCATSGPLPPPNAKVLSTGSRNYRGRMGDPSVDIMLASPATCAAAAASGRVVDPRSIS